MWGVGISVTTMTIMEFGHLHHTFLLTLTLHILQFKVMKCVVMNNGINFIVQCDPKKMSKLISFATGGALALGLL